MPKRRGNGRGGEEHTTISPREERMGPLTGSPFSMMRRFADEMDRAFGSMTWPAADWWRGIDRPGTWSPQVELFERDGNLMIHVDLPGMKKEDVTIEVRDDALIVEGERKETREEKKEGLYRTERSYGRFFRRIPLPDNVDTDQAVATFNDGVLEVKMPAPEQPEGRSGRRIEIQ